MTRRFGEEYYAEKEAGSDKDTDSETDHRSGKKKVRKPKWDDDIDIRDIVPDFEDEDEVNKMPAFALSNSAEEEDDDQERPTRPKSSKDRQQERQAKKKASRLERKRIEDLVDSHMDLHLPSKSKQPARFRYRETSPTSFGLTARDILMAPDSSLNQFAGLKKMASFRDAEKKRKDKKHLGKKARLRQWRKETFGNEDGPEIVSADSVAGLGNDVEDLDAGRKKKKRSRKNKGQAQVAT
jgi:protein KRI1